jgi:hypothetical protein
MEAMYAPVAESYQRLKERTRHRYEDWAGYLELMSRRLGQTTVPALSRFAAELEASGMSRGDVFKELAETWAVSGRLGEYYDRYPDMRKDSPAVFRFESTLDLYRSLMSLRDEVEWLSLADGKGAGLESLSPDRAEILRRNVDSMKWLSDNFGIYELAEGIREKLDGIVARASREDLSYASTLIDRILGKPKHLDVESKIVTTRFANVLLRGGFYLYAKASGLEEEDALLSWGASDMRRCIVPELLRSSPKEEETKNALIDALQGEWSNYNECLLRQYAEEGTSSPPSVLENHYRYGKDDARHHAVYRNTWNAYDYIYGLEVATAKFAGDDPEVRTILWNRFKFLKEVVDEYAVSLRLGEPVFTSFGVRAGTLSQTPELEELFSVAKALRLVDPEGMGDDAFVFLKRMIDSTKLGLEDRGYMLRRIREFYETTDRKVAEKYKEYVDSLAYEGIVPYSPPIPGTLDECESFDQRAMKRWADREIELQLSLIRDVTVDISTRRRALVSLSQWGGSAAAALPTLDQLASGQFPFTPLASTARKAHSIISGALRVRGV